MKLHWKILLMLLVGVVVGGGMRALFEHPSGIPGVEFARPLDGEAGLLVRSVKKGSPADLAGFVEGKRLLRLIVDKDRDSQRIIEAADVARLHEEIRGLPNGLVILAYMDVPRSEITIDDSRSLSGATFSDATDGGGGVMVLAVKEGSAAEVAGWTPELRVLEIVVNPGTNARREIAASSSTDLEAALGRIAEGTPLVAVVEPVEPRSVSLKLLPECQLDRYLYPFRFVANIFLRILKMLIVPLILTSIISGVAGLGGGKDFGRMGSKTMIYYFCTSLLAAAVGLLLVNIMRPGIGAKLGLGQAEFRTGDDKFSEIFIRMVPENAFDAFSNNANMLQVIFFSLLFGYFITRVAEPAKKLMTDFFAAAFDVMMKLAGFALALVPYGVFALMVKVVAETGYEVFVPLGWYMLTVFLGLLIHAGVTLSVLVRFVGKVNPYRWFKAMSPALLTAFSTSSSSMTLPVSLETVEERGGVSNKTSSFVLPLGATVNMDGTALYECVGVIFLAQYYWGAVSLRDQVFVVMAALLASIGAAGIPSAGLVMMLTILSALKLPVEGAALLLAVDRPLDMCRTMVNVWSDTCGTAIIASSEKEVLFGENGPSPGAELPTSHPGAG